jgi:biofilm PGA synthesis N-glycosyltransferase PgaC
VTSRLRMAIVVPFLDEERHLGELLASMARQTRTPEQLLLVDDGSSDGSRALAEAFARRHPWAAVAHRPPHLVGADRLAGGTALQAFACGVERLAGPWDVVAKVDADLRLTPATLETLEAALLRDAELGIAGAFLSVLRPDGRRERQRLPRDHVHGETKFYRRACWEQIGPLPAMLGWDTIDVFRARLRGWRTQSFEIPGGDPIHLRPMGTHDGLLRGYRRWGRCAWGFGEHPLHVIAIAVQRLGDQPRGLGSANYVAGWAAAAITRAPRAEPEVREYVRRDQLRRLRRRLAGRPTRSAAGAGS